MSKSRSMKLPAGTPTHNPNLTPNLTPNPAEPVFDHEKLEVYQEALLFCAWAGELIEKLPRIAARDQLDRASTSIPLNIAEGNAKFSLADRSRFFKMARGSAVECPSCLDILVVRKHISRDCARPPKERLAAITRMLVGLLRRFSPHADRLAEDESVYEEQE
jgi:four helix bundle protein